MNGTTSNLTCLPPKGMDGRGPTTLVRSSKRRVFYVLKESSPPRPCSAPILVPNPSRSLDGSSCVGRWRQPSKKRGLHLGVETQRQWSELAIRRTTPALFLGLFSLVSLLAHQRMAWSVQSLRRAAWYRKPRPTFSDALALVRKELWAQEETFWGSLGEPDTVEVPRSLVE
jgi:hypothetical protein